MAKQALVCSECGYVGAPKSAVKGSIGIEIVLWLFLIFPGLIYSIWRSSSRHPVCAQCGNDTLIPIDSPRGKKLMQENLSTEEVAEITKKEEVRVEKKRKTVKYLSIGVGIILLLVYVLWTASL